MCGICGYVDFTGGPLPPERLARMTDVMAHRGPDGRGTRVFSGPPFAALGHRRLAVLDLSEAGSQPMRNENGDLWLTYNGEIYNHRELRRELAAQGHVFRSGTDSEVVLHAFEEWGEACLSRFHGMFAFGLWDERHKRLFLARDRLGEKPLLYAVWPGGLAFASEMNALLAAGLPVSFAVDPLAVSDYFSFMAVPEPETIFQAVKKLPPAHSLSMEGGEPVVRRWWDIEAFEDAPGRSREAYLEELDGLFSTLVSERLVADVPVGAFLSGGVDSGLVAGYMAAASSTPPRTFHVRFDAPGFDESEAAARAAQAVGARHTELEAAPRIAGDLPRLARLLDEPFGVASAIPLYYMAKAARESVTVVLTGDGGDELFAGYERYRWDRLLGPLSALPWGLVLKTPGRPSFRNHCGPARQFLKLASAAALGPDGGFVSLVTRFSAAEKAFFLSPDLIAEIGSRDDPLRLFLPHYREYGGRERLGRRLFADMRLSLPGEMLAKVDRCAMAAGLESRPPLVDHRLVEFAARLPARFKTGLFQGKLLLRGLAGRFFPAGHVNRRKQGFSVPLGAWLRGGLGDMARDALLGPDAASSAWLRRENIARMFDWHDAGRGDWGEHIYMCLMFELWLRGLPA